MKLEGFLIIKYVNTGIHPPTTQHTLETFFTREKMEKLSYFLGLIKVA